MHTRPQHTLTLHMQRDIIRQRSAKLGGDVHFQMAKMYEHGAFQDSEPDIKSAIFHVEAAAELGHRCVSLCPSKISQSQHGSSHT
jgi:hypothetical protein